MCSCKANAVRKIQRIHQKINVQASCHYRFTHFRHHFHSIVYQYDSLAANIERIQCANRTKTSTDSPQLWKIAWYPIILVRGSIRHQTQIISHHVEFNIFEHVFSVFLRFRLCKHYRTATNSIRLHRFGYVWPIWRWKSNTKHVHCIPV